MVWWISKSKINLDPGWSLPNTQELLSLPHVLTPYYYSLRKDESSPSLSPGPRYSTATLLSSTCCHYYYHYYYHYHHYYHYYYHYCYYYYRHTTIAPPLVTY